MAISTGLGALRYRYAAMRAQPYGQGAKPGAAQQCAAGAHGTSRLSIAAACWDTERRAASGASESLTLGCMALSHALKACRAAFTESILFRYCAKTSRQGGKSLHLCVYQRAGKITNPRE